MVDPSLQSVDDEDGDTEAFDKSVPVQSVHIATAETESADRKKTHTVRFARGWG